ncbi:MAG: hypothetical protein IPO52_15765 [Gemmatimonadetes bacterium]|nr:hypothetical protein [Gemmatimonadota bacterium]
MPTLTPDEARDVRRAILKLNAQAWGTSFGMMLGVGLFLATIVLVLKGGENVGEHLSLLSVYFPGYRVSWGGAFLGFIYAFVLGYAIGRVVGTGLQQAGTLGVAHHQAAQARPYFRNSPRAAVSCASVNRCGLNRIDPSRNEHITP